MDRGAWQAIVPGVARPGHDLDFESVSHSVMSDSLQPQARTVALQVPLSMGFLRQEYWSGLPFPPPGDLPNPGIKPSSPTLQVDYLPSEPTYTA